MYNKESDRLIFLLALRNHLAGREIISTEEEFIFHLVDFPQPKRKPIKKFNLTLVVNNGKSRRVL